MKNHDQLFRFVFDDTPIRGQLLSLDASWQKCLQRSDADEYAQTILGHALAAVTLLASTLKIDGNITLQIRGQGPIHLLVAQSNNQRSVRGLVRQTESVEQEQATLQEVFGADKMVITIDNGRGKPHQGIVPLRGSSLQDALEAYFEHSEQLPTRIWLASNENSASGLLLQKLPGEEIDDDSWNRVTQLASTITQQELIELSEQDLLHRLFHEETLRLFESEPVHFSCSCSREKTLNMIKSLGKEEADDILSEQGQISVTCEFCNNRYDFDPIDIEQVFSNDNEFPGSRSIH